MNTIQNQYNYSYPHKNLSNTININHYQAYNFLMTEEVSRNVARPFLINVETSLVMYAWIFL